LLTLLFSRSRSTTCRPHLSRNANDPRPWGLRQTKHQPGAYASSDKKKLFVSLDVNPRILSKKGREVSLHHMRPRNVQNEVASED